MIDLIRVLAAGFLSAVVASYPALAQTAAPTDPSGKVAPSGTAVAPSQGTVDGGGRRPPMDAAGQTAPAGTPVAPSSLARPDAASPAGAARP